MIEYFDFIKLYCIHNAKNYKNFSECYKDACAAARYLYAEGTFDSDSQVNPNDFLIALSHIQKD